MIFVQNLKKKNLHLQKYLAFKSKSTNLKLKPFETSQKLSCSSVSVAFFLSALTVVHCDIFTSVNKKKEERQNKTKHYKISFTFRFSYEFFFALILFLTHFSHVKPNKCDKFLYAC